MWPISERNARRESGFTLLELLIAVAIMAICVIPLFVTLNAAMENWRRGAAYQEAYQNARGALDVIARDMSSLHYLPNDASTVFVVSQQHDSLLDGGADYPEKTGIGEVKWVTFTSTLDLPTIKDSDLARVLYFTWPDDGTKKGGDFTLRRAIVYEDLVKDPRRKFEQKDDLTPVFPFPESGAAPQTWEEFLASADITNYMDPTKHSPLERREGDEVASNILDIRFSFRFTKYDRIDDEGATPVEKMFYFQPDAVMKNGDDHRYSGWCSLWNYYPDPNDTQGATCGLEFQRTDPVTGDPVPIGLPRAVDIEVRATNDAGQYKEYLKAKARGENLDPPAVAAVKDTVWLTAKWMEK